MDGEYLGHKRIHAVRTTVGGAVSEGGETILREHNRLSPAQDVARLLYWLRFMEALGTDLPRGAKGEMAEIKARWPLEDHTKPKKAPKR